MDKTEVLSRDLAKYWAEMIKGARSHQVGLVPFERQLFRYFYNSGMKYKGFTFKYYHGEEQNPFEQIDLVGRGKVVLRFNLPRKGGRVHQEYNEGI